MMENADRSLSEMALERLCGGWQKARVVVLAGTGVPENQGID
jgi:NAD(P)H-hydrate repair Nnr-like enzyme with NAD(P)H-hydrate epimerase domain